MPTLKVWNGSEWEYLTGGAPILQQDAEPGSPVEGDLWIDTDEPSGSSALLASLSYRPGSDVQTTTTSATFVDIDATNLAVTFTVPASGAVLVRLTAITASTGAFAQYWGLRSGSSDVSNSEGFVKDLAAAFRVVHAVKITGLTPAASLTWKWAQRTASGTMTTRYGTLGPATMEVWSA